MLLLLPRVNKNHPTAHAYETEHSSKRTQWYPEVLDSINKIVALHYFGHDEHVI